MGLVGRQTPRSENVSGRERIGDDDWRDIELLASQMVTDTESVDARELPLIAVCDDLMLARGTLFNRLTGSRRSIVGMSRGLRETASMASWSGWDARRGSSIRAAWCRMMRR